jgi:hypothetical protein
MPRKSRPFAEGARDRAASTKWVPAPLFRSWQFAGLVVGVLGSPFCALRTREGMGTAPYEVEGGELCAENRHPVRARRLRRFAQPEGLTSHFG